MSIALRGINKKGERQNRCHDDKTTLQNIQIVPFGINLQVCVVFMMINHLIESNNTNSHRNAGNID